MIFLIHAPDRADGLPVRQAHFDAHRAYLADVAALPVEILVSGPFLADDDKTSIGSIFIVEAPDRAAAEAFHHNDPFYKAGLWPDSTVSVLLRRRGSWG